MRTHVLAGVGAVLIAGLVVGLAPIGAGPALATHPCGQNPDGTTFDPSPTADDAACSGDRPAPRPGDVQLGDADAGRTVSVATGARVYVDLHPPSGQIWSDVSAGNALHRRYLDVQSGITSAVFTARSRTGGQQIQSQTDGACEHGEPACARPERLWSVTVLVADPASPAPSASGEPCTLTPRPQTGSDATDGRRTAPVLTRIR